LDLSNRISERRSSDALYIHNDKRNNPLKKTFLKVPRVPKIGRDTKVGDIHSDITIFLSNLNHLG